MRIPAAILALLLLPAVSLAGEEGCGVCHGAERLRHEQSVHRSGGLTCVSCHGGDPSAVESAEAAHAEAKGFLGRPSRAQSALFCGTCHSDVGRMRSFGLRTDVLEAYRSSHHGKAVLERDDPDAATCLDCHGSHDVARVMDPRSPAYRSRVPATCGRCHGDEAMMKRHGVEATAPRDFAGSVHGRRLAEGEPGVPNCASCHDAHAAAPPGSGEVASVCGACHRDALEMFRRSPHFAVSLRGEMKQCVTCHGNHAVGLPDYDLFDRPPPKDADPNRGTGCVSCHDIADAGDRGGVVAAALGKGFRETDAKLRDAKARVDDVASRGFFVEDERESLAQARRELVQAVPLAHTADLPAIQLALRRSHSFVDEALVGVEGKIREERDRRILGSFGALVLFVIAGFLALRRRRPAAGTA
ncbi:MAG: cytochrome c family protein [Planctomycetes bacterium]|nr:cytochrome c family protein [Planctomycetota bacterium]